jgi:ATP-dependent Clp protease ATP-binding subunit ClpC
VLDNFGYRLTKSSEGRKTRPVVGREREIERLAQILSRRKKKHPVLMGNPVLGNQQLQKGLALRITKKNVSRVLVQ